MRALITGIGGFVGGHLAALLHREGFEVWGLDRAPVPPDVAGVSASIEIGDVCDAAFVDRVVRAARPTHVFHLATSFDENDRGRHPSSDSNVLGVSVLLAAIGASAAGARVLVASSSAVYGSPDHQPIDEDAPLKPATAYGASKVESERAAAFHRDTRGIDVVVTRTFNALGPRMPRRLFAGSLAAQIATAEEGGPQIVRVGRLDSRRDYLDVRDAVRAYVAIARLASREHTVFNVCSGVSRSGHELADEMLALATVPVTLVHDTTRLQAGDIDFQQGSAERLRRATGWAPEIAFSKSVRDTLDDERLRTG